MVSVKKSFLWVLLVISIIMTQSCVCPGKKVIKIYTKAYKPINIEPVPITSTAIKHHFIKVADAINPFYYFEWTAVEKASGYILEIWDTSKEPKLIVQLKNIKEPCCCYDSESARIAFENHFNVELKDSNEILQWRVYAYLENCNKPNIFENKVSEFSKFVFMHCNGDDPSLDNIENIKKDNDLKYKKCQMTITK